MKYKNSLTKVLYLTTIFITSVFLGYSSLAAGGGGDDKKKVTVKSSEYYKAVKLIKQKSYDAAIQNLLKAEKNNKTDADIYNYLGFSYRKTGNLEKASQYYNKALEISPKNKCSLEYQWEMFLTQGNLKKAQENLKKLQKICFLGCEEEKMLKESIMKYNKGQKSSY